MGQGEQERERFDLENVPFGHVLHIVAPSGTPTVVLSEEAVEVAFEVVANVPGSHAVQMDAPGDRETVPTGHEVQEA